jgi:hypothetical protein
MRRLLSFGMRAARLLWLVISTLYIVFQPLELSTAPANVPLSQLPIAHVAVSYVLPITKHVSEPIKQVLEQINVNQITDNLKAHKPLWGCELLPAAAHIWDPRRIKCRYEDVVKDPDPGPAMVVDHPQNATHDLMPTVPPPTPLHDITPPVQLAPPPPPPPPPPPRIHDCSLDDPNWIAGVNLYGYQTRNCKPTYQTWRPEDYRLKFPKGACSVVDPNHKIWFSDGPGSGWASCSHSSTTWQQISDVQNDNGNSRTTDLVFGLPRRKHLFLHISSTANQSTVDSRNRGLKIPPTFRPCITGSSRTIQIVGRSVFQFCQWDTSEYAEPIQNFEESWIPKASSVLIEPVMHRKYRALYLFRGLTDKCLQMLPSLSLVPPKLALLNQLFSPSPPRHLPFKVPFSRRSFSLKGSLTTKPYVHVHLPSPSQILPPRRPRFRSPTKEFSPVCGLKGGSDISRGLSSA